MQHRYWLPEYGMLVGVDVLAKAGFTRKLPEHIKFICLKSERPMVELVA